MTARPETAVCDTCGATFPVTNTLGPVPKYCKPAHRQRHYEARLAATATADLTELAEYRRRYGPLP